MKITGKVNDWVYDIEFYQNFFCACFRKFPEGDTKIVFEISSRKDERQQLLVFLQEEDLRLIGFNNVGYDYPVLHMLIENPEISLLIWWKKIQKDIFGSERSKAIWDSQRHVFQIDLFKINHYDNMAKSASLKWLEFTKRWHKVQDLPIHPNEMILESQMDLMIRYCWNDVDFTFDLAVDCWSAVKLRENMTEMLGRNVMDYSDVKIGEFINQKKYEEVSGKKWRDFKEGRTYRKNYKMSDIIPDVIQFKSEFMQKWLEELRKESFVDGDKHFKYDIVFCNKRGFLDVYKGGLDKKQTVAKQQQLETIVTFAKGGLHSVDMPRVVNRKEGWTLQEKDVGSMYPRGIIVDGIHPQHLGEEWNTGITDLYNYRIDELKPKLASLEYGSEEWQKVEDEQQVYKLAMNGGGFGKLGSAFSWQYDPLAKYRVTMGCELKLLMLIEDFILNGIEIVSVNTDGVVVHYPQEKAAIVEQIHKDWEETTDFLLENTDYSKIVFSSVNDYIAVIVDPVTDKVKKVKYKGDFEIDKDPHKNNSQRIVAIALSEYFIKDDVKLKDVIGSLGYKFTSVNGDEETTSIYDYCIGKKKTSSCEYWFVTRGKAQRLQDKVIRYYVSKDPNNLLKKYTKGASQGKYEKVNAGFNVTLFMDYFPSAAGTNGHYNIDMHYYLNECRKIIKPIEAGTRILERGAYIQGTLF